MLSAANLSVALLFLGPGLATAMAAFPPAAVAVELRLAVAFAAAFAVPAAIAVALASLSLLTGTGFLVAVIAATVAAWALALRRGGPAAQAVALARQVRDDRWQLGAGAVVLIAYAAYRVHQSPLRALGIGSALRYWDDGLLIARAHHVPALTPQYGFAYQTTVSKVALNAFEAGLSFGSRGDTLAGAAAIVVLASTGMFVALWALAREAGLGASALLVPVLVVAAPSWSPLAHEFTDDLVVLRAEDVGRMVALCALAVALGAVRGDGRWRWLGAGLLLGVAAATHLIPVVVVVVMLAAYVCARPSRPGFLAAAGCLLAAGAVWLSMLLVSGGTLGFNKAGATGLGGLPPGIDPTETFKRGVLIHVRLGRWYVPPRQLFSDAVHAAFASPGSDVAVPLAVAALVASVLVGWRVGGLRRLLAMAWAVPVFLVVAGLYFSLRYVTGVPATFGPLRLFEYLALPMALVIAALVEAALGRLPALSPRTAAVVVGVAGLVCVAGIRPPHAASTGADAKPVLAEIAAHVPCGVTMLPNMRTGGTFDAMLGRPSLLEGPAPYLRPDLMQRVLPVLLGARAFFVDPSAHAGFLAQHHVGYVIFLRQRVFGHGAGRLEEVGSLAALKRLPRLHLVALTPSAAVFAVSGAPAAGPGTPYRCPSG